MTSRRGNDLPAVLARGRWGLVFLVYLLFVVYGSLVPLEWRHLSFADALTRFSNIGFLELGIVSRADWVANIVLYVPLAFLACVWILGLRARGLVPYVGAVLILLGCILVAVAVEFAQIFFAPRTVSLNDLLAESIGSLLGVLLWVFGRWRVFALGLAFAQGGRQSIMAAVVVFTTAYLLLALFPYDFVVSAKELGDRLQANSGHWLVRDCGQWLRCGVLSVAETLMIAPLALLLTLLHPRLRLLSLFAIGVGLGVVIESLQLLLFSGSSQGLSVLLRGIGMVLGSLLARLLMERVSIRAMADLLRRATPVLVWPYLLLAAALSGWLTGPWLEPGRALARLPDLGWVPFYYHYWTTEPVAMASLLSQLALYMPVGLAFWANAASFAGRRASSWAPAAAAVLVALLMESGKLFAVGSRPDPTNVIIAPAGAMLAYWAAIWFARVLAQAADSRVSVSTTMFETVAEPLHDPAQGADTRGLVRAQTTAGVAPAAAGPIGRNAWLRLVDTLRRLLKRLPPLPRPTALGYAYATALGSGALVGLALYPVGNWLLLLALLLIAAASWWLPWLWLVLIPAALPALDLSPTTGRLALSAFDILVLVSFAVSGLRLSGIRPARIPNPWLTLALLLLWLSWLVSMALGLAPYRDVAQPVASSHSPSEAWSLGKGILWALLAVPLLLRLRRLLGSMVSTRLFLHGIVIGLLWTCLVVVFERHVFVGLFDFDNEFRVTGPFASMNTGGAYIEVFLAFAFPMLLVWILAVPGYWAKWLGGALLLMTGYATLVTFSRGGYGGLVVGLLVLLFGLALGRSQTARQQWLLLGGLLAGLSLVAVPVLTTGFAKERLSRSVADLEFRLGHWQHAISLMGDGVAPLLFGEGFGRYPDLYLFSERAERPPGTFKVVDEGVDRFLRLGNGETVYLDQSVAVRPDTRYRLSLRLRAESPGAELSVPLCEKALLYSFICVWTVLSPSDDGAGWQRLEADIQSGNVGRGGNWPHGRTVLSVHNSGRGIIDIDDVSLKAPDGRELIANGGFDDGAERWLFVTDQDLAWHIDEQFVETYFAQGLLGLSALAILLIAAAKVLWPAMRAGRLESVAFAAALAGFLSVGLLGSTVDAARTAMLFYLGALAAALLVRVGDEPRRRGRGQRRGRSATRGRDVLNGAALPAGLQDPAATAQ